MLGQPPRLQTQSLEGLRILHSSLDSGRVNHGRGTLWNRNPVSLAHTEMLACTWRGIFHATFCSFLNEKKIFKTNKIRLILKMTSGVPSSSIYFGAEHGNLTCKCYLLGSVGSLTTPSLLSTHPHMHVLGVEKWGEMIWHFPMFEKRCRLCFVPAGLSNGQ